MERRLSSRCTGRTLTSSWALETRVRSSGHYLEALLVQLGMAMRTFGDGSGVSEGSGFSTDSPWDDEVIIGGRSTW